MTAAEIRASLEQLLNASERYLNSASADEKLLLLGDNGVFDSVMALQLVLDIEERFGIVVEDAEIHSDNFRDLNSLTAYIHRKLA